MNNFIKRIKCYKAIPVSFSSKKLFITENQQVRERSTSCMCVRTFAVCFCFKNSASTQMRHTSHVCASDTCGFDRQQSGKNFRHRLSPLQLPPLFLLLYMQCEKEFFLFFLPTEAEKGRFNGNAVELIFHALLKTENKECKIS